MTIASYSDLQTAIQTWMARSGDTRLSGNAADIITLAESRLNRVLPLNITRADTTYTGTVGSRLLALPSDYYVPISLKLTTFGVETMLTPKIAGEYERRIYNAVPQFWSINGTNIELDSPCDQAHTFTFRYRQKFALSNSVTTNWLLTNHPDAYLQACLVEAEFLAKDWQSAAVREGRLDKTIEEISEKDAEQLSIGTLFVEPAMQAPNRFNINSGF